jgi:hypothetical protein
MLLKYFRLFSYLGQKSVQHQQSSTSIGSGQLNNQSNIKDSSSAATVDNANSTVVSKLPPRPADYDYFYYQDEEGNWWNEYDDMGYEFDPNRYEGQEEPSSTEQVPSDTAKESSSAVDKKNKDVESSGGISELKVRLDHR